MKNLTILFLALLVGTTAAIASRVAHPPVGVCCGETQTICKKVGNNTLYGPFALDTCP